jgi:hypothetical protein
MVIAMMMQNFEMLKRREQPCSALDDGGENFQKSRTHESRRQRTAASNRRRSPEIRQRAAGQRVPCVRRKADFGKMQGRVPQRAVPLSDRFQLRGILAQARNERTA